MGKKNCFSLELPRHDPCANADAMFYSCEVNFTIKHCDNMEKLKTIFTDNANYSIQRDFGANN